MSSKSTYPMDPTTGLPALAPNQLWRVSPEYHYDFNFYIGDRVQLVEETTVVTRWLKKEKKVVHVLASARIYENTSKETILQAANEALSDYKSRQVRKTLLGDYPPKRLSSLDS
jgi:hypothetical protein